MIINNIEYKVGGIYSHYHGNFYNLISIGKLHDSQDIYIITYYRCTNEGEYIEIPNVFQPFCTDSNRWNDEVEVNGIKRKRFELIK